MEKLETGIYRLPDGRFRLRATTTDPSTGKRIDKQQTLPEEVTTLQEARTRRQAMLAEIQPATSFEIHEEEVKTVGDYAALWYERKAPGLKPTTRRNYLRRIDDFILPFFDEVPIERLSRGHVVDWVNWADSVSQDNGAGYSRATRRGWWHVLKMILLDLKAECGLQRNPVERVKPPQRDNGKHRERRTLSREELALFLREAETKLPTRFAEIYMMATTGMRVGEVHGLMWSDLDYDAREIHVRRSASKGILVDTTKTGYHRQTPMIGRMPEILREHRKDALAHEGIAALLVFPSSNGKPRFSASLRVAMNDLSEVIGFDIRVGPQVLRRTFNTLLLEAGVSEPLLRATMGHSNTQMTELYAGFSIDQKQSAVGSVMEGVL